MMIAEESTAWPGVTRPDCTWADWASASSGTWAGCTTPCPTSRTSPVYRQYHHNELTFSLVYAYSENYILPLSHDEVVHGKGSLLGKMPGDDWQQIADAARAAGLHVGPPRQAAAVHGPEFGQGAEWSEERGLDWWLLGRSRRHPRRAAAGQRPERGSTARRPALWSLDTSTRRASTGSTPTTRPGTRCRSCGSPRRLFRTNRRPCRCRRRVGGGAAEASEVAGSLSLLGPLGLRRRFLELRARHGGVRGQLLRWPARELQDRPAARGPVDRGPQHRRGRLRRQRRRQPRRRRSRRRGVARPPGFAAIIRVPPSAVLWLAPESGS